MAWRVLFGSCVLLLAACSGSEFESDNAGGASGSSGSSGASGSGGTGGAQSITIVQATDVRLDSVSDIYELTLLTPPTAGNAIIVGISCFSEVENCTIPEGGVADNQGNTYALVEQGASVVSSTSHGARPYLFIAENIAAPVGPLVISADLIGSISSNYQNIAWGAIEVAGLAPAPSVDQSGRTGVLGGVVSTTVETDAATTQPNELAVAVLTNRSNDADVHIVPEDGWTQHHVNQDGQTAAMPHSMVSRVFSTVGVVGHTWTHDPTLRATTAIIATFRGAATN